MRHRAGKLLVLTGTVLAMCLVAFDASTTGAAREAVPQRRTRTPARSSRSVPTARVDYTKFSHASPAHRRTCDACHTFPSANWKTVRAADAAFPDVTEFPNHAACLSCHREQFFARERPAPRICSVCHVGVTPKSTVRRAFPNPPELFRASKEAAAFTSDFEISFPHDKHLGLFGRNDEREPSAPAVVRATYRQDAAAANATCANCHQLYLPQGNGKDEYATPPPKGLGDGFWLKRGTFETAPDSHASCVTCHSVDSGLAPAPTDCATCHKLAAPPARVDFDAKLAETMGITDPIALAAWRRRDCSAAFRHEGGLHTEVACTTCHDVAAMNTADQQSTKVRVPSCGGTMGCHVTASVDDGGALNFEIEQRRAKESFLCSKCHIKYAGEPLPASHVEAVAKAKSD